MPTTNQCRPVGRPKGEPSTIVNVRLPLTILEQLDRYIDSIESYGGKSINRSTIARQAVQEFLARHTADMK